jgi:hypothetical protein
MKCALSLIPTGQRTRLRTVFHGSHPGQTLENAAEAGRVGVATTGGNFIQLQVVTAQQMFAQLPVRPPVSDGRRNHLRDLEDMLQKHNKSHIFSFYSNRVFIEIEAAIESLENEPA